MRVHIGTDHAGFELKEKVVAHLREAGHDVVDHGAHTYDALDDYPPFCIEAAQAVVDEPGSLGVVIGGSGNGEQMAANCVQGVRAALVWSDATARLAREHNDANMMGSVLVSTARKRLSPSSMPSWRPPSAATSATSAALT